MSVSTPDWVKHAIFYQVFPDRFARSPRTEHDAELSFKPWGTPPEEGGFQGGDLRGVTDRLDYLEALGVTALYLNPIFASASNHRYHTYDYYEVDPLLGGNEALRELLDAAHERGIRVVLDGVFNHTGRGFWPFHHVLENGGDSPYIDWFTIEDWPLRPYAPDPDVDHNYDSWMDLPALPALNVDNPDVRRFLFDVARHWIEFGIDGWRLDVPQEIDDPSFWKTFRRVVKDVNPEAYLCGEIWGEAPGWLQGDRFDAVMNYPLVAPILSFCGADTLRSDYEKAHLTFAPLDGPDFAEEVERVMSLYDWEVTCAQLNLLDSHDMARARWIMGGESSALRLAVLCQMTLPGAPCIYYGDEIGLSSPGDPHCREAFPWDDEARWNRELLDVYRRVTQLRHDHVALRTGSFRVLQAVGRTCAFHRSHDEEEAVVVLNAAQEPVDLELPEARSTAFEQAWPAEAQRAERQANHLAVTVPPREALVLTRPAA